MDLEKLKSSQQVFTDSLSSIGTQLTNISKMSQILEDHGKRVESLENENSELRRHVDVIDRKMDELDQKSRDHNIQIDGIPQNSGENLRDIMIKLAAALKVPLSSDDITNITRVQSTNTNKCKPIICNVNKSNLLPATLRRHASSNQIQHLLVCLTSIATYLSTSTSQLPGSNLCIKRNNLRNQTITNFFG